MRRSYNRLSEAEMFLMQSDGDLEDLQSAAPWAADKVQSRPIEVLGELGLRHRSGQGELLCGCVLHCHKETQ